MVNRLRTWAERNPVLRMNWRRQEYTRPKYPYVKADTIMTRVLGIPKGKGYCIGQRGC